MRVVVFLGPSLPLDRARRLLDAEYHGPISLGDLCGLMLEDPPPDVVGIVDGLFEQVPTVWHKEILYALSQGVQVFGSSSIGALRAAELASLGMRGVGEVFERFESGRYTDDDEVTIVHGPPEDEYRPISEAMVNIRYGLELAAACGCLSGAQRDELTAAAKALFYPDRSWSAVFATAERLGYPTETVAELREVVRVRRPDVKAADATALLRTIAQVVADGVPAASPESTPVFEPTYYWEKLVRVVRDQRDRAALADVFPAEADPPGRDPALPPAPPAVLEAALDDLLVMQEARRLGLRPAGLTPAEVDAATADVFRPTLIRHYRATLSGYALCRLSSPDPAPHPE